MADSGTRRYRWEMASSSTPMFDMKQFIEFLQPSLCIYTLHHVFAQNRFNDLELID